MLLFTKSPLRVLLGHRASGTVSLLGNSHSPCPIASYPCPTVTSVCFIVAGLYSLFDPTKARRGCGGRLSDGRNRGSLCPPSPLLVRSRPAAAAAPPAPPCASPSSC